MDERPTGRRQLTFEVEPHPDLKERDARGEHIFLTGSMQLKVDVPVVKDLNSGDKFMVTIVDADGELIARRYGEVKHVAFPLIKEPKIGVIGQDRAHKAELTDDETF
jgi:hypothetical protein